MARTQSSTYGERRLSSEGAAKALLDELDELVARRDAQEGLVGNLRGKLTLAQNELSTALSALEQLEARASATRRAFEVLKRHVVDEEQPEGEEPELLDPNTGLAAKIDEAMETVKPLDVKPTIKEIEVPVVE